MSRLTAALLLGAALAPAVGAAPMRGEFTHPAGGHEVHVSAPAVAVDGEGQAIVAWIAAGHDGNRVFVTRPRAGAEPVPVSPGDLFADSLHQAPGLAVGPGGEVYVTWSSTKPKPAGALFASDLQLSRSLDGGRTFERPLRINEERPTSHSFEGLAVAPDGTLLVAWIDTRGGHGSTATWLARVVDRGSRVERVTPLPAGETCVCCRVSVSAGPGETAAVLWRKVFPGDVRDMVLSVSADGGRSFAPAGLVHADDWKITACPHRGGTVATDGRGRRYVLWYTERRERPEILLAVAADGQRFGAPRVVHAAAGSVPDNARLAVSGDGRGVIVWEDATAVRRRILFRTLGDGGRTLGPVRVLSQAIKAWSPDVAAAPGGFVVAWHEERFPATVSVVQHVSAREDPRR
ncbi:MAG TPA: hypothetical protein VMQ51_10905 [Candidatus Binatia bacterium]|nr:hypothetical protein [Candidatus Binatia bacterium]